MAFGDWMVPKPSLAAQARLQHDIATVRKATPSDMARLVSLTERLLVENMQNRCLVRQATSHIARLEMEQFLRGDHSAEESYL
jgi:hypothetical protein